jgi:predicted metalloprotease with PDZ domain
MYGLGAERQLKSSFKGHISSLIPVPVRDSDDKPVTSVRASYANFLWGVPATDGPGLPVLGVSLAGKMGKEPTKVIDLDKHSPADQAGIKVGDVLLALDGTKLASTADLQRKTADYLWGDTAKLTLQRGAETMTLIVPFRRPGR